MGVFGLGLGTINVAYKNKTFLWTMRIPAPRKYFLHSSHHQRTELRTVTRDILRMFGSCIRDTATEVRICAAGMFCM